MAVFDLYSKRKKRAEQVGSPDVYRYDGLPKGFRVQVAHIWQSAIGRWIWDSSWSSGSNKYWETISDGMRRERGVFVLIDQASDPMDECIRYLCNADPLDALDIIELSFRVIDRDIRRDRVAANIKQKPDDAIAELNERFREHGLGYRYTNGLIVRVDSLFAHAEIVKPALQLLCTRGFEGPNEEFLKAFEHYRHNRLKEAVAEALKAFESTMKAICRQKGWSHPQNATAKPLLDLLFQNGLIPSEFQAHFAGFRSAMESGLPTLSNRTSRHGQGPDPQSVPRLFAAHALHLCAANIVFLVEASNAWK